MLIWMLGNLKYHITRVWNQHILNRSCTVTYFLCACTHDLLPGMNLLIYYTWLKLNVQLNYVTPVYIYVCVCVCVCAKHTLQVKLLGDETGEGKLQRVYLKLRINVCY